MTLCILLALGGAAGAIARFTVAGRVYDRTGAGFPWGTLVVNVAGSFLLGLVLTGLAASPLRLQLSALLAVGFLGDFTTFSTFAYETVVLAREGQPARALTYLAASTALALLALVAGLAAGAALR